LVLTRDLTESFSRKRAGDGATKVAQVVRFVGADVAEWSVASATDQTVKKATTLRGGNAPGREARETNTAQPAYRKLYAAQVGYSAGNGIRETLVTASSENEPSAGNSARHRRNRKRWSGKIITMSR
jgi:hypothetical protein